MGDSTEQAWLDLTETQRIALANAPKPTSLISTIVSLWVGISIIRDKNKMSKMYHRLALGLCISSAVNSFFYFLSSWAVPAGTDGSVSAIGTDFTCSLTGFFHQLGFVVPCYYVSLAFYVYFALKCKFRIQEIEWMEKYIHIGVFVFPLTSSIYLASANHLESVGFGCWMFRKMEIIIFAIFPIMLNFILAGGLILFSYLRERKKCTYEREARRFTGKKAILEIARQQKARLVAKQGALFLAVFVFSYTFVVVAAVVNNFQTTELHFQTLLLALIFHPTDGLFFTIAYVSLLGRQTDLTVELEDTDKVHRMSYSLRENTQRRPSNYVQEREVKTCLPSYSVSLFDGLDEEKWKAYGVYVGSGSDSSFDDDYAIEFHNEEDEKQTVDSTEPTNDDYPLEFHNEEDEEQSINSTEPTNDEIELTEENC